MRFDFFSDEELMQVHEATLKILGTIGIHTLSERFKKLLLENGCLEEGDRILFPQTVIEKALKTVPAAFNIYDRNGRCALEMGKLKAYTHTCVGTPSIMDLDTGERRDCYLKDLAEFSRVTDALEFIDVISPVFPRDVPQDVIVTVETATMLRNTIKPMRICAESSHEMKSILGVLAAVAGGETAMREKPVAYIEVSSISPLEYGLHPAEALIDIVEAGMPLGIVPCPMMGSTGPMTLVGSVAQHNAEILAGVVASQMVKSGAPVVMSPRVTFMDMKSGVGLWAMPEMGLAAAASIQLSKYYHIPSTAVGYSGAAKIAGTQSGYEHLYNALLPALVGTDIIGAAGSLDNCLASCLIMLVIDNELASVVQRTIKGVTVSEDTLAVEVIRDVVNSKGNFLTHKHTRKFLRAGELWVPPLGDRQTFEKWAAKGETLEDAAKRKAKEILATHQVEPLHDEVNKEIDRIISAAQEN
ncbi:trimethylamine methyltransferase family protein [Candidatus Formimonas warabiya]|uniref:Trimethylamine--corrinoid methyltransferase n=1 Tax=Formimonas warabiya TaxID=1761012 RepID=A0A3G1L0G9_FORW1|nr:trimethylamine methyltransferase family protein [Candidatus Formimonas warabiya]ATW28141.1 trimethylamine--corrinoid methyltransferase [Candidatus Formimonas warabiya]